MNDNTNDNPVFDLDTLTQRMEAALGDEATVKAVSRDGTVVATMSSQLELLDLHWDGQTDLAPLSVDDKAAIVQAVNAAIQARLGKMFEVLGPMMGAG